MTTYKIQALGRPTRINGELTWPPEQEIVVALEIDYEDLARILGRKAFQNKSRTAVEVGGYVRCKVVKA